MLNSIDKALAVTDKWFAWFLAFIMASMVAGVTWQVLSRFVLSSPSSFTEELARFQLIWIGILGAAYAFRRGAHLGLDLFTSNLPLPLKLRTAVVANLFVLVFSALVMVYGGAQLVALVLNLGQLSAALQIKIGYVYSVIPVSGFLICIYAVINIYKSLNGIDITIKTESDD